MVTTQVTAKMENNAYAGPQRRKEYRVRYPITDRPRLRLDSEEFEVINLSEGGLKFHFQDPLRFVPWPTLQGTLVFADGETKPVQGSVLRTEQDGLAVELSSKIPYRRIVQEQIRLTRKKVERPM
jgi:hypothetical protein